MQSSWLGSWLRLHTADEKRRRVRRRPASSLPLRLEVLESRLLPSLTPQLLKDINVGSGASLPADFTAVGGEVFFRADDGSHDQELWKTDGTAAGTVMVKDLHPGSGGAFPTQLTNVNGTLFFQAISDHGQELWRSDGTAAGTVMLMDIFPPTRYFFPNFQTNFNGTLFFSANVGSHGSELWRSNGTLAGTVMVKDIQPGLGGSYPRYFANMNGTLFFQASDGSNPAAQLWRTDGTAAGTSKVAALNTFQFGNPPYLTNVNGTLFFAAGNGSNQVVYRTDGTPAGTTSVGGGFVSDLTNVNGTLFFDANDITHGHELWKSNGVPAGTVMVQDINPGSAWSSANNITNVNGTVFFDATDGAHGAEPWRSDGTEAGTVMVKDIAPGPGNSVPLYLTNINGTLFFSADDGTHGRELWQSDGTEAGTVMIQEINPGPGSSNPMDLTNFQGRLLFSADDGMHGQEPWILLTSSQTVVNASPNPSVFGQPVTFTASIHTSSSASATPTGTVTFEDGGASIGAGTVSAGLATFSTAALSGGGHAITALYAGDGFFAASTSPVYGQRVVKDGTATALTATPTSTTFGQALTLSATVSADAPTNVTPTGTVVFEDGTTVIGNAVLDSAGQATFQTAVLAAGSHVITAAYRGSGNFLASFSEPIAYLVNRDDTTTAVRSSLNPSVFGAGVTFAASVRATPPGRGLPTGAVTFMDGNATLGTSPLSQGQATFGTTALAAGNHTITAVYQGDANFNASTSRNFGQTVQTAVTTPTLTTSANPAVFSEPVTFTLTEMSSSAATPTGTVTFKDGATTVLVTSLDSSGQASWNTSSLAVRSHTISAVYDGGGNFTSNTSMLVETVHADASSTSLASSNNPSIVHHAVTFTATVHAAAPGTGTPTGLVTFMNGAKTLGVGTLVAGQATFSTAMLHEGHHTITAAYGGDAGFTASSSGPLDQIVQDRAHASGSSTTNAPASLPAALAPTEAQSVTSTSVAAPTVRRAPVGGNAPRLPALQTAPVDGFFTWIFSEQRRRLGQANTRAKSFAPRDDWLTLPF
jgi:ELWxxDGT repeat protein